MNLARLAFVLLLLMSAAAHSDSSCLTPKGPAELPATKSTATGKFTQTIRHGATSSGGEAETQYQLWLLDSGHARVQRDHWAVGDFDNRSTGILRGRWFIQHGYVVLFYGGYCGTFELSPPDRDAPGPDLLRGVQGLPSSAWLLLSVLERSPREAEPTQSANTPPPNKGMKPDAE